MREPEPREAPSTLHAVRAAGGTGTLQSAIAACVVSLRATPFHCLLPHGGSGPGLVRDIVLVDDCTGERDSTDHEYRTVQTRRPVGGGHSAQREHDLSGDTGSQFDN